MFVTFAKHASCGISPGLRSFFVFFGLCSNAEKQASRQNQEGEGKVKRSVSYITDEGFGYEMGKNKEDIAIAESSASDIFRSWRQVVIAAGLINQPWHHKLRQIRKERYE
ncbi:hypothetical protein QNH46_20415 [Paenibacillus woosongensis]|uniref:Uncharacterized protein n=1 Tax=Paenibacillus woosongensis TaxID=307580 RepID=A0A7X2Z4G0_9BACL|nr:hypothetical protein [Paenibacillus woosongensis]MUG46594.1 hypothetical protein [Paenibacillus woosongensis]WHX48411.1 hypothetical protein QNH46_20415 [Paenibacillus woosongensis]